MIQVIQFPIEVYTFVDQIRCVRMFTATLFIMAKNWRHLFLSYKMDCDIFMQWDSIQQGKKNELLLLVGNSLHPQWLLLGVSFLRCHEKKNFLKLVQE